MKTRQINRIRTVIGLVLLLSLFPGLFSCQTGTPPAAGTDSETGTGEQETDQKGTTLTLAENGKASYTVVYPEESSSTFNKTLDSLVRTLSDRTGVRFSTSTDLAAAWETEPLESEGPEIIVGNCFRKDTVNALKNVRFNDYTVCLAGDNLLVAAHNEETAIKGIQRLIGMIEENAKKTSSGATLTWKGDYTYHALGYRLADKITVNQVPIRDFRIVYPAGDDVAASVAREVQAVIGNACGDVLETVPDSKEKTEHEIRVGDTNRSAEIGNSAGLGQGQYWLTVKDGAVYLIGASATLASGAVAEFKNCLDAKKGVLDEMNVRKSLINAGDFAGNTADIRIMEYNVLVEFPGWGSGGEIPADVNLRKDIIASLINGYSPDVLCLCEFFDNWRKELPPLLDSKFKFVCIDRPDGLSNRTSLVYNSETLTLIDGGYEDISIHPNTDQPWPDDVNHRVIMWGVFEVKATGRRFMTLGTHYTSTSSSPEHLEQQKVMQVNMTLKRLAALKAQYNVPAIILGDLNTAKGSESYAALKNGTGYGDVADEFPRDYLADHIFYDPRGFSLKNAILEKGKKTNVASDHKPMIADFDFLK